MEVRRKESFMKKRLILILILALAFLMPATALAAPKNSDKSNGNAAPKKDTVAAPAPIPVPETVVVPAATGTTDGTAAAVTDPAVETPETATAPAKKASKPQQAFNQELNAQKKELQQQKSALAEAKEALETEYEALLASGDTVTAEAAKTELNRLKAEMDGLQSQIKQIINQRYMVVKTMYTDEELAQFENVSALIEKMMADAKALDAGSVTINNQLIKFDAPIYIKGGDIMVPVKAITEKLDAEVVFNAETKTLTITRDNAVIEITAAGVTATIDGTSVDITDKVQVTCGRTYLPLDLLAEILDLDVTVDNDNGTVDVDMPADGNTDQAADGTTDPAVETPAADGSEAPVIELIPDPVVPELQPTP
jgi:hypothetical protein